MKSRYMLFFIVCLVPIFMSSAAPADTGQSLYTTSYPEHYKYYSGHHWQTYLAECSANPCTTADSFCDKDTINCPASEPYKRWWTVNSFREAMAYQPYFDEGDGIYTYSGAGTYVQGGLISDSQIRKLRVYVPKGATSYTVVLAGSQTAYGVVVRWKQVPEGTYINAISNDPNNLNYYDVDGHVSLDTFAARDVYFANPGGTLSIINGGLAQPVQEGGWLYIYFFYTPGGSVPVSEAVIRFRVDKEMFYGWYDDIEANSLWDTENEPPPKEGAVPDTTPTDISHITNAITCEAAGGYWCNSACQVVACSTTTACTTQTTCTNSGFFWCTNICQETACSTGDSYEDGYNQAVADLLTDSDGDGVVDAIDECAATPYGSLVNNIGCSPSLNDLQIPALGINAEGSIVLVIPRLYLPAGDICFWRVYLTLLPDISPLLFKLTDYEPVLSE